MEEMVRAKMENGAEATVTKEMATRLKLEVLDKPAVDARGYALSDKPHITLAKSGTKYDAVSPEELQADADARQLTVEGSGKEGRVLKNDLISALVGHDSANGVSSAITT